MKPIALGLIKVYKVALSPYMPGQCRFSPTCSDYAAEAIGAYGVVKGTAMTASRLARCRPGVEGGYDPAVPDEEFAELDTAGIAAQAEHEATVGGRAGS